MRSSSSSRVMLWRSIWLELDPDRVDRLQGDPHALPVPVLGDAAAAGVGVDGRLDHVLEPARDELVQVAALEDLAPGRVHLLALLVQDVVVLDDVLAVDEVELLDLLLRALDAARQHLGLDRLAVGRAEARVEDLVDPLAGEQADDLVLRREEEARLAGVALAAGAAAQLVVDPARLVPLGAEHVEAAPVGDAVGQLDVDPAAGHVGRDRDRAQLAGVGDDHRLALVVLGVQHLVRRCRWRSSSVDRCSDTSTEIVPTSTGWPLALRSTMSSTTAANFSSLVR